MEQSAYTVEQLLTDDSFLAYVLGTDPQAVKLWESRLHQQPQLVPLIEEATQFIQLMAIQAEPVCDATLEQEAHKLEARLSFAPLKPISFATADGKPRRSYSWLQVAALLLFLLVPALFAWVLLSKSSQLLTCQTPAGKSGVVVLPDSSLVFLGGNSTLRYAQNWQGQAMRQVWLQGEAFFHVRAKPLAGGVKFLVHAANATVEVLGTRFEVSTRGQRIKVILNSGKVKLQEGKGRQAVFMEPGEMVELSANSPRAVKSKVSLDAHPAQKESKVVFQDASIGRVALVVEEFYGLKVSLQDSSIANLKISGTLPTNNQESFLKALAVILDLEIIKATNKQIIFKRNPLR